MPWLLVKGSTCRGTHEPAFRCWLCEAVNQRSHCDGRREAAIGHTDTPLSSGSVSMEAEWINADILRITETRTEVDSRICNMTSKSCLKIAHTRHYCVLSCKATSLLCRHVQPCSPMSVFSSPLLVSKSRPSQFPLQESAQPTLLDGTPGNLGSTEISANYA